MLKPVIIESPFAGDVDRNLRYLRAAMHRCLLDGEAPFASHALYTQPGVLDDTVPHERELGIAAGFVIADALARTGAKRVVFRDLGYSRGMEKGIEHATQIQQAIEFRSLLGLKG